MHNETGIISGTPTISFDYSPQAQQKQAEIMLALITEEMADCSDTLYLLVDPVVLMMQPVDELFGDRLVARKPELVRPRHSSFSASEALWLLTLDLHHEDDRELLKTSIKVAVDELHPERLWRNTSRAVCGWLTSSFDTQTVARQLGETIIQQLFFEQQSVSGEQRVSSQQVRLRYYDPVINNILWPVLDAVNQQRLMGVLSRWMLLDGDSQPVIRRFPASPYAFFTFSLGLLPELTDFIMIYAEVINRTLDRYRKTFIHAPRYPELVAAGLIHAALDRLNSHPAFCDNEQREDLAFRVLRYHPQIDQHPKIHYLLDPYTFSDDVPWTTRIRDISMPMWEQYAQECTAREYQPQREMQ